MLFDNLPDYEQRRVLGEAVPRSGELPVIVSVSTSKRWLLITTDRIFFAFDDSRLVVNLNELKDATVALGIDVSGGAKGKADLSSVKLIMESGEELFVIAEPGPPFFGVLNVLRWVATLNTKKV